MIGGALNVVTEAVSAIAALGATFTIVHLTARYALDVGASWRAEATAERTRAEQAEAALQECRDELARCRDKPRPRRPGAR